MTDHQSDDDEVRILVLWDVDHTLIENGGMSKATYARSFVALAGVDPVAQPSTDGRTDLEIMNNLFAANGVDGDEFSAEEVRASLAQAMQDNSGALMEHGFILPGVADALRAVAREISLAVQSVLTGNLIENAAVKLRLLGDVATVLDLDVGGYGSDDIVRSNLVKVAQDRASAKYGGTFGPESTILFGDTTRDVEAGLVGGAMVIGVASGATPIEDLRAAGAHRVLQDLTDTGAVLTALRELAGAAG